MEREIKFRGKRVDNGEWVVGNLFIPDMLIRGRYICHKTTYGNFFPGSDEQGNEDPKENDGIAIGRFYEVISETVGEFTGLTDKNGKDVYEGDILAKHPEAESRYIVYFRNLSLSFTTKFERIDIDENENSYWKEIYNDNPISSALFYKNVVIGNIYETPELLTQAQQ